MAEVAIKVASKELHDTPQTLSTFVHNSHIFEVPRRSRSAVQDRTEMVIPSGFHEQQVPKRTLGRATIPFVHTRIGVFVEFISVSKAAKRLGVHRNTVRSWIHLGLLPAFKIQGTRKFLIRESHLSDLVAPAKGGETWSNTNS